VKRGDKENLTGQQKAAVLMVVLGEEISARVFKQLDAEDVRDISREIARLGAVPAEVTDSVVEEFYQLATAREYAAAGGIEYAKKLLLKSLGAESARTTIDHLEKLQEISTGFSALERIQPRQLAKFISNEHPQTIALILARLSPVRSARLLTELPEDMRGEIIMRMTNLDAISPEILEKITGVLDRKLQTAAYSGFEEYGGIKAAAQVFNRMEHRKARQILDEIEARDPDLAFSIKDLMFVFEDILTIDDQGIMEILKRIDKRSLALALKGANDELKAKFFNNMSKRAAAMLDEEMEYLGPIRIIEVERAQHEIVEVIRSLEEEGIILIGEAGEEEYAL
jgi:flagellar motor switch protein FliG